MKKEECSCDNGCGIASVVLGIVGLVLSVVILPIFISITGLVFGIIQYRKTKDKWALWGIILSVLGILVALLVVWKLCSALIEMQNVMQNCIANPSTPGCAQVLQLVGNAS